MMGATKQSVSMSAMLVLLPVSFVVNSGVSRRRVATKRGASLEPTNKKMNYWHPSPSQSQRNIGLFIVLCNSMIFPRIKLTQVLISKKLVPVKSRWICEPKTMFI